MSDFLRTRTTKTDSISSVNKDKVMDVELKSTSRTMTVTNVRETIDQYKQFLSERAGCSKHRLILTLKPFCTNVLFNTLTEIVYKEGDKDAKVVSDGATPQETPMGRSNPSRPQMVDNTEYSQEKYEYSYHPGFDIFNNHIIRNQSFKVINPLNGSGIKDDFNTISDLQRRPDGSQVMFTPRISLADTLDTEKEKHLYDAADLLSYSDSINANLTEENGWFGFINVSSIDSRDNDRQKDNPVSLNISRVLNNKLRCEFIDMYPDRTLFSFSPKFNPYQKRLEYNWDICLTYPASSDNNHPLVKNGLKLASVEKISGYNGRDILLFRTYTKHGLKQGDSIYFYYSPDDDSYTRTQASVSVTSLGNLDKKEEEYYFWTTDLTLIHDSLGEDYWYDKDGNWFKSDSVINNGLKSMHYTLKRLYNGYESEYYFRLFQKVPNFRRSIAKLTENISRNSKKYESFIEKNARTKDKQKYLPFANEYYRLAFANTIYDDDIAQITFNDDIDIEGLTDNLGRPLTEIYVTIIKTNKGHEKFYKDSDAYDNGNVEYSHCFGPISSGINFGMNSSEYSTDEWKEKRRKHSDILTFAGVNDSGNIEENYLENDITLFNQSSDKPFYGDLVEYSATECRETVLDIVEHRFNTMQREMGRLGNEELLVFDEIVSDDYDKNGFNVQSTETASLRRPEGYYYQPHYRIPLKSFDAINQASHWTMKVRKAQPKSTTEGMMVSVTTRLEHHLSAGDIFYIVDPYENDFEDWIPVTVVSVENSSTFLFSPFVKIGENTDGSPMYHEKLSNWIRLCDILNATEEDRRYKIYRRNDEIPDYAKKIGLNSFLWRNILSVGDSSAVGLPEYPYANGYFYIHRPIDLFLKRQDPFGYNGLYEKDLFPNDVAGKVLPTSNYEYQDESQVTC